MEKCKVCNKELEAGTENRMFMALKPTSSDDVRCEEHRNE
jgi:hypothetical protein